MGRRLLLLIILLVLQGSSACKKAGEAPPRAADRGAAVSGFEVGGVVTRTGPSAERPITSVTDREMGRRMRQTVLDLEMFHEEPYSGPQIDFTLTWTLGVVASQPPEMATADTPDDVVLYLHVAGRSAEDHRFEFELETLYPARVTPGSDPVDVAEVALEAGFSDIAEQLASEAWPFCQSDGALVSALAEPSEAEQLLPIVRQVRRRRLQAANGPLRALLQHDSPEVALAAATALGQLGDSESVGPLIDMVSRRRRALIPQVLPILGEIGSDEARLYLETVRSGHEDPAVQRLAAGVLDEYWGD